MAQACAADFKPLQLELGGNNTMMVLNDADLDVTEEGTAETFQFFCGIRVVGVAAG